MVWADRFRWSTQIRRNPGSLVSVVGVTSVGPLFVPNCRHGQSLIGVPSPIGSCRLLRMASTCAGCGTSLLYWTTGPSKHIIKVALKSTRLSQPVDCGQAFSRPGDRLECHGLPP